MANYSFPLLKSGEILLCLHELQIASTEEDLQKPNPLKVQLIYSQFIELLLNQRREDMVQPAFSGIQELEFPELHEESVPTISFLNACQKLMTTAGITDFTMSDVSKPDAKRLRRNISAVINFAKFREERLTHYVEYTQETDSLAAKKVQLQEENERLVTEVNAAQAHHAKEAPEEQRVSAENAEREVVVRELWNKQTAVQKESQALKAKLHEVQDEVREVNYKLLDAKEEVEKLSAQIVPDPKALKEELVELQEAVAQEKAAIKAQEAKRQELSKQKASLIRAEAKVEDLLQLQAEVQSEQDKLSGVRGTAKGIAEEQMRDEALSQRYQHGRERMEKQRELHASKAEDAQQAYSSAKSQWDELHSERARHTQQTDENEAVLREVRDKLLFAKMEHEADANRMQQQQQQLALQVRAYHENVFTATKAVSAQTAALVS